MAVTFTSEQQRVIDLRGCNILVSAAAGSGKTAVLVERIVKRVCDEREPVDIDRLLVVTFTNAAAAEMRERIAGGIAARLAETPDSEHIQRQAALLHNAQITTIDSFCLFLLRNHFNEIGLDPAFRIADEGEVRLMQQDVLKELLEESYAEGSAEFHRCVEYFCPGGREGALERHILSLSRYASGFPWPEEWLEQRKSDYGAGSVRELGDSGCGRYLTEHLAAMAAGWLEKMERVRKLCQSPDGPYMYGETVDREIEQLEGLTRCSALEEYEEKLPAVTFGRLSSRKDESVLQAKRELAADIRSEVKKSVQKTAERFFATSLKLAVRQGAACREPVETLVGLTQEFDRRMAERKREKRMVDFSDMEHFALNILLEREAGEIRPSRVALEYRQYFEEILIDEYQDSNLVQEFLLQAVSGEDDGRFNRFMVGDVKQSIYRFRLARPELFLEKYDSYTAGEGVFQRIDLTRNFRSRFQVVDAVNHVFSRLMSRQVGGIDYDDRAALYPGAVYPESAGCETELLLTEKPPKDSEQSERRLEAKAVAGKIRELRTDFLVTDRESGGLRPAKYSDMVILLRAGSGWDEEFRQALEEEGIPVYVTSKTGYFAASEVQELLQVLHVLDNPRQDVPLFGVMKSVFGGFSEEEIALIRSGKKNCTLYEALQEYAGSGHSEETAPQGGEAAKENADGGHEDLREKAAVFLETLKAYRRCISYMPVRELLTKLVEDFDYLNYVTALPAGGKRRANVEMLFARASDFEKTSYFGLFHFLRYMEQLEKYEVDYGEAELLGENADVVRIMSIHKSKGLEFPITFVSGLGRRFNLQDVNQSLILDVDLGLATDYVDPEGRVRNKTFRRNALARKLREESLSEELRILYVAMTRAREKLILTASLEKAAEKWETYRENGGGRLSYPDFIESAGYLDFLLPIISGGSIRVSVIDEGNLAVEELREGFTLSGRRERLERLEEPETFNDLIDREALGRLRERLCAVYPHSGLEGLYTKTTVSELKIAAMADKDEAAYHIFEEKEIQPYIPKFIDGEEKVGGAVRGNAYHRVMELLDFGSILGGVPQAGRGSAFGKESDPDYEDGVPQADGREPEPRLETYEEYRAYTDTSECAEALRRFLGEELRLGRLKQEYYEAVNEKKLLRFLSTRLAYRMRRAQTAGRLYREQPFVMGVSASRLGENFPDSESVLIQGIIDVFFEEEDGLVLLDYKTDAVSSMRELWNRYETQLDYYSEALTKLVGRPVKERILYSFHLGEYETPTQGAPCPDSALRSSRLV